MSRTLKSNNQLSTQHDGDNAEAIEVIEPGPNPPTVVEVATRMVAKITTNADQMLDALIRLAKEGHYQAAQYLLSEMHRLSAELKRTDRDKWSTDLGPLVARLRAEYYKRQAITIDADPATDADGDTDGDTNGDEPQQPPSSIASQPVGNHQPLSS